MYTPLNTSTSLTRSTSKTAAFYNNAQHDLVLHDAFTQASHVLEDQGTVESEPEFLDEYFLNEFYDDVSLPVRESWNALPGVGGDLGTVLPTWGVYSTGEEAGASSGSGYLREEGTGSSWHGGKAPTRRGKTQRFLDREPPFFPDDAVNASLDGAVQISLDGEYQLLDSGADQGTRYRVAGPLARGPT